MNLDLGLGRPPGECRVVVAMSGGVDSSVTAALLAEAGYGVVGVTLQLYDHGAAAGRKGACCAGQDIDDARDVANRLGIPHYVLDFEARFKAAVIDDFTREYAEGRTPIPCVRCNERVKFTDLLEIARDLGADALATGHYARRLRGAQGAELHKAADAAKDQSYFLFATTAAQLDYLRFPLGDLDKAATRAHALRLGLEVADKPDSQDICFVPSGRYSDVVAKLRPDAFEPGDLVHVDGRVLGQHEGMANYTVGQRRGLKVADGERLYVVDIEPRSRRVTVGPKGAGCSGEMELRRVNWLPAPPPPGAVQTVMVKHRYNEVAVPARIEALPGDGARVTLDVPQAGIAPGQACVAYLGTRLLAGGWIERAPQLWREAVAGSALDRPPARP